MGAGDIFLKRVAPAIGAVLANIMFVSPLRTMLRARRAGKLGKLNPIPFPIVVSNTLAWIVYAGLEDDYFIFWANFPGFLLGTFFTISAARLARESAQIWLEITSITSLAIVIFTISLTSLIEGKRETMRKVTGYMANVMLFTYYAAPLSTLAHVLRTRSSDSLYWPLCLANFVNGTSWTIYGIALLDAFIYVPNGAGAVLALCQLLLSLCFKRKETFDEVAEGSNDGISLIPPQRQPSSSTGKPEASDSTSNSAPT